MTVQRATPPADSRLGELGETTRALLTKLALEARSLDDYVPERTLRDDDYLPAWLLRVGFERARSVARIELVDGAQTYFGTGFMVSPNLLMTNHHVLPNLDTARRARVFFDYEDDEQGRQLSPQLFLAQPDRYFLNNELLDVALVAVDGEPGRRWGMIPLRHSPRSVEPGGRINVIQHPRGGCKQIVMHGNEVVEVTDAAIHYLADTEGGSSGSPVFNNRWELVALHHRGGTRDNVGVRMDQILKLLTVVGSERGASPMLRELLDGVLDNGDFGLFATTGLSAPTLATGPSESGAPPIERVALDWMGGAEFLDPGYWDLSPIFVGLSDEGEAAMPRLGAVANAVEHSGADFMLLEGIPAKLRPRLAELLTQRGQTVELLGERALLSLDPAVSVSASELEGEAAEVATSTCAGRRVLPAGFFKLRLALARAGGGAPRALYLLYVEIDPARDLPSRAHRNELARVLGTIALACGRDVVIVGVLAGVLDRPGLHEVVAPPELTILASPTQSGNTDVGAIAWVGDGLGADLERVYCWPEVRTVWLDAKVERHDFTRRVELGPELLAARGGLLLLRAGFGELERQPAITPSGSRMPESMGKREIPVDAHVRAIVIVESTRKFIFEPLWFSRTGCASPDMTTQTAIRNGSRLLNLLALAAVFGISAPADATPGKTRVEGGLDKSAVREVVRANIGDVRDCYNAELVDDEAAEGRVMVSFEIRADGTVGQAEISESTMPERFDACLATAVATWSFPASTNATSVLYPFVMSPG